MADDRLVLYLGIYESPARAAQDLTELAELHRSGRIGTYDGPGRESAWAPPSAFCSRRRSSAA
jgi:hypothetical protein